MNDRLYPARPILAVSVAVFREARVLVVRRAREPMLGRFSLARGRRRDRRDAGAGRRKGARRGGRDRGGHRRVQPARRSHPSGRGPGARPFCHRRLLSGAGGEASRASARRWTRSPGSNRKKPTPCGRRPNSPTFSWLRRRSSARPHETRRHRGRGRSAERERDGRRNESSHPRAPAPAQTAPAQPAPPADRAGPLRPPASETGRDHGLARLSARPVQPGRRSHSSGQTWRSFSHRKA